MGPPWSNTVTCDDKNEGLYCWLTAIPDFAKIKDSTLSRPTHKNNGKDN
jgi:hypothetical protein